MGRANNSSVDTTKGDRLAKKMNEKRNVLKAGFAPDGSEKKEQIVNARKAAKKKNKKK